MKSGSNTTVSVRPTLPEIEHQGALDKDIGLMQPGDTLKKVFSNSFGTATIRAEKYDSGLRLTLSSSGKRNKKADYAEEIKQRYANGEKNKDIAEDLGISPGYASQLRRQN